MVFWYNPNPEIDKNNVPSKVIGNREIPDYLVYGKRPWVIVSSDEVCIKSNVVQTCPLHTNPKVVYPNDVGFYFKNSDSCIKCEQIRTINANELQEYDCILDDDIMDMVDICLKRLLGLQDKEVVIEKEVSTASMADIEKLIMGIVNQQVEEAKKQIADNVQIDDAVLRISEGLSNLFEVNNKPAPVSTHKNNVIIVNNTDPASSGSVRRGGRPSVVCGTKRMTNIVPVRTPGIRHQWTDAEVIEFMHDFTEYNAESLMKKYGCETFKQLRDLKNILAKKMNNSESTIAQ